LAQVGVDPLKIKEVVFLVRLIRPTRLSQFRVGDERRLTGTVGITGRE
jgi:hypothetical protein